MKEDFLHFIWQYQYFNKAELQSTTGDSLTVIRQGFSNKDSGPDFHNSRIKINTIEWIGNIEIHYKSSDWYAHHHNIDKAYDNVILHVVWSDDKPVRRTDNSIIPTLELKNRIDPTLILKYSNFIKNESDIICAPSFSAVSVFTRVNMFDKVLLKRLEEKASRVSKIFKDNGQNWEATAYTVLALNFGFKINEFPFERLSRSIPFNILFKIIPNLLQLEALLFGSAGLLEGDFKDEYPNILKHEYKYLIHKYALEDHGISKNEWKFSKTRPANFPTIRIYQFALFLHHNFPLFTKLIEFEYPQILSKNQEKHLNSYWENHYLFDKETEYHFTTLGKSSISNIVTNTVVPLMVSYAREKDDLIYQERAIALLEKLPSEKTAEFNAA